MTDVLTRLEHPPEVAERSAAVPAWRGLPPSARPYVAAAGLVLVLAASAMAAQAQWEPVPVALGCVALAGCAAIAFVLLRRPWLAPWAVIPLFCVTSELQLRISSAVGVSKDALVALLVLVIGYHVRHAHHAVARLRPFASPLAALAVLAGLYVLDVAGSHGSGWVFGTRLLLEGVCLLVIGLLSVRPHLTLTHLVRAFCVMTAFEAVFAWIQQLAGQSSLVYSWGYAFGSQVRQTSGGGLRTSGTFSDPFQLSALAVLALCVAAFLATRRQAVVIVLTSVAIMAATSVRSALIEGVIVLVLIAFKRRWFVPLGSVLVALASVALFAGLTITTVDRPGAEPTPLLLGLNGRSTAWSLAVTDTRSLLVGHGVGIVGAGSGRGADGLVTSAPTYDPTSAPTALFSGNTGFLDSSYAQVQSDVGIAGTAALLMWIIGMFVCLRKPLRRAHSAASDAARWAAIAVLAVSSVDWVVRTTLGSYTTGFLTLFTLGVVMAASVAPA